MKYMQMAEAFYERLETTPLSVGAIAVWHALMHMNDKQNGSKEFKAALAALCLKSGLKENMLEEARQELMKKGLFVMQKKMVVWLPLMFYTHLAKNPRQTKRKTMIVHQLSPASTIKEAGDA